MTLYVEVDEDGRVTSMRGFAKAKDINQEGLIEASMENYA